jgi:hypothetical protein
VPTRDPSTGIFWTGEQVISDGYTAQHLEEGADDIQRKPFIWDNHISNDSRIRTTGGDAGVQGEACHLGHRFPGGRLQDPKFVIPVLPKP